MTEQILQLPGAVTAGRFGTWQYDVVIHNPGPDTMEITSVEWSIRRRDGQPPLHPLGALSGNLDPALFFSGSNQGRVAPGQTVRGRAAHFSHWEEPIVDWRVTTVPYGNLTGQVSLEPVPPEPFMYAPGREAVMAAPDGPGPFPALLILHPYGGSARAMGWAVQEAVANGWVGMAISQPGFGGSDGPWDYAGRVSQDAALAAIEFLREQSQVGGQPIGLWGISLGAMLGGLVAAQSVGIAAAALQAGVYDLEWHQQQGGLKWLQEQFPGADLGPQWLAERSVTANAGKINCPVLLIHGDQDTIAPVEHARRLDALLRQAGKVSELAVLEQMGHGLPPLRVWSRYLGPFLRKYLTGS